MNHLALSAISGATAANASQAHIVGPSRTRALLGFLQPQDTPAYLSTLNPVPDRIDPAQFERQCVDARVHVGQLGTRPEPQVTPLGDHPHLALLRSEVTFAEHSRTPQGVRFAMLNLKNVVACQPRVDWDHVERLADQVPAVGDEEALLRFCLPLQQEVVVPPAHVTFNPATNTFGSIVDSPDVRVCGPMQGEQPGTRRGIVGFSIGPGLHQMSVVSFNGRHMLNNGYHRAVALARAGHEAVPVIFVEVPALEMTPSVRNGMFNPSLTFGPQPARIVDFLGPAAVEVSTKKMRFLFSIHAEQHAIPA